MENKSNANSIWTERLKINSLKKKWISLMSQSKINEIEKLLAGANNALKVRFIKLESEKSLSDIPRINSDEMIQLPCNKSILHDKSYKKNNKNYLHKIHAAGKENFKDEKDRIKTDLQVLQKDVADLKEAMQNLIIKSSKNPRRRFP